MGRGFLASIEVYCWSSIILALRDLILSSSSLARWSSSSVRPFGRVMGDFSKTLTTSPVFDDF
jgi:hypothetical protein